MRSAYRNATCVSEYDLALSQHGFRPKALSRDMILHNPRFEDTAYYIFWAVGLIETKVDVSHTSIPRL